MQSFKNYKVQNTYCDKHHSNYVIMVTMMTIIILLLPDLFHDVANDPIGLFISWGWWHNWPCICCHLFVGISIWLRQVSPLFSNDMEDLCTSPCLFCGIKGHDIITEQTGGRAEVFHTIGEKWRNLSNFS